MSVEIPVGAPPELAGYVSALSVEHVDGWLDPDVADEMAESLRIAIITGRWPLVIVVPEGTRLRWVTERWPTE